MSRAFLKDDAVEAPVVVPARAPLPPGATNYVTPRGMALLHAEKAELEAERARLDAGSRDDNERKRQLAFVTGRLSGLNTRLASARLIAPATQPQHEVRFGALVTLRAQKGSLQRQFQIVGVDEADAREGRIAFTAPIAQALSGKTVGGTVALPGARGMETFEITAIRYDTDAQAG